LRDVLPTRGRVAAVAAALVLVSSSAFATAISSGQDRTAGQVTVNINGIFFSNFATTGPDTGAYAGNTTVTQGNLNGAVNLAPNISNWATFSGTASGTIIFDLKTLSLGIGSNADCGSNTVGNVCTPTGSPITLSQIATNTVSLSLSGNGIAYTGTSGSGSTPTIVSFTTQNNMPGTITGILAAVLSENGFTESVSATYTSASSVPEPMTVSMLGIGLVGLGLFSRRRKA
jgi:hypothetical protein